MSELLFCKGEITLIMSEWIEVEIHFLHFMPLFWFFEAVNWIPKHVL